MYSNNNFEKSFLHCTNMLKKKKKRHKSTISEYKFSLTLVVLWKSRTVWSGKLGLGRAGYNGIQAELEAQCRIPGRCMYSHTFSLNFYHCMCLLHSAAHPHSKTKHDALTHVMHT